MATEHILNAEEAEMLARDGTPATVGSVAHFPEPGDTWEIIIDDATARTLDRLIEGLRDPQRRRATLEKLTKKDPDA